MAIAHVERQTLRQWVKRGLLPKARIVSDGHGVKSRWPRSALERARLVTELRAQLYTLDEIVGIVGERLGLVENDAQPDRDAQPDKAEEAAKTPRRRGPG